MQFVDVSLTKQLNFVDWEIQKEVSEQSNHEGFGLVIIILFGFTLYL